MDFFGNFSRNITIENISNDFDEASLIDIFRQAGTVTNFHFINDVESQKFTGIASCEYHHPSMALNAVRMFNKVLYNGNQLRVALTNQLSNDNTTESIPDSAISQAVASLPPDQMYELMKQMKVCIQNNPNEARNMLLQNPQLAYALLQAQIVMKIVDPKVAIVMLNRSHEQIPNTSSLSHPIPNQMPLQPYAENVRHLSIFPDLPLSQHSINQTITDPYRPLPNLQIPTYSKNHKPSMPILKPELDIFNPIQKYGKIESSIFDSQHENEKTALIMQVLKLSDHQISLLPEDQRRSILILKEQLNSS